MMSSRMISIAIFAFLSMVTVQSFVLPNYGTNYVGTRSFPAMPSFPANNFGPNTNNNNNNGFGLNTNPMFPNFNFPSMPPMTSYYPGQSGVSVITNNASAQGPNSAGSGATGGGSVSGHGVSVGGSASSSGSFLPGTGASSSSNGVSWSSGTRKAADFPQSSYGSYQPNMYNNNAGGQYPASYNYPGVAGALGFQQMQMAPQAMAYAWVPMNV